ncbi:hypothetical protein [Nocardia iowensis]|uniref:hypothetical protein n=1 Tax=Nocardia iowensis TaxID=204891 RepID=UPI003C2FE842
MPAPSRPRRLDLDEDRPVRTERELPRLPRVLPDAIAAVSGEGAAAVEDADAAAAEGAGAVPHTSQ